jgi:hypothetical protein
MRAAGDIDHPDVIAEYEEIIAAVGKLRSPVLMVSFLTLFRTRGRVSCSRLLQHGHRSQDRSTSFRAPDFSCCVVTDHASMVSRHHKSWYIMLSLPRTGVTTVVVYAPTLFRIAGFGEHKVSNDLSFVLSD